MEMFVVLQGRIAVSRARPGVGEPITGVLGPGDMLGELAVFERFTRLPSGWQPPVAAPGQSCRLLVGLRGQRRQEVDRPLHHQLAKNSYTGSRTVPPRVMPGGTAM